MKNSYTGKWIERGKGCVVVFGAGHGPLLPCTNALVIHVGLRQIILGAERWENISDRAMELSEGREKEHNIRNMKDK